MPVEADGDVDSAGRRASKSRSNKTSLSQRVTWTNRQAQAGESAETDLAVYEHDAEAVEDVAA